MAHIFNGTMDFPTRPGRNAQRGHYATVYFSLSRLEPWQHYIKAFICQEPSVEGPVERRRCSARRFYTSPATRSVISASTSRLLNYNGNHVIHQICLFPASQQKIPDIRELTALLRIFFLIEAPVVSPSKLFSPRNPILIEPLRRVGASRTPDPDGRLHSPRP